MTTDTKTPISLCGIVDLLAAIFERDPDELRLRYGILPKYNYRHLNICIACGKPTRNPMYCNKQCQHDFIWIPLICPTCDRLFYRRRSFVLSRLNHPSSTTNKTQEQFFCHHSCNTKSRIGIDGFAAHPENIRGWQGERKKKWGYVKVYELRDKTGWGAIRLGRALGMPSSTVGGILAKRTILGQASIHGERSRTTHESAVSGMDKEN